MQFQVQILTGFPVCTPFLFPIARGLNFAQSDVATISGDLTDFGIPKNRYNNVEFAPLGDLLPLIQW